MFALTRLAPFTTQRLIIIVLIAGALACPGVAFLWSGLSASAMRKPSAPAASPAGQENEAAIKDRLRRQYGRLPMNFEVNQGQADESVKFLSRGHGYQVFLTDG